MFESWPEAVELGRFERAALLTPRPDRVQSNDREPSRDVDRLRRSKDTVPLFASAREACRKGVRDVMVPRHREEWETQAVEQLASVLELRTATAVSQIARDHEDLRSQLRYQPAQSRDSLRRLTASEVEIRDVKNPSGHQPVDDSEELETRSCAGSHPPEASSPASDSRRARRRRRTEWSVWHTAIVWREPWA